MSSDPIELLRNLRDGKLTALNVVIDGPLGEDLYMDFKEFNATRTVGNNPAKEDKYSETLSEMASAFANVGGGLIVWGVEAKGINRRNRKPISDVF